ncbi:MAG: GDSL-type esterase/lipase family protein [Myxococcota bacterium]
MRGWMIHGAAAALVLALALWGPELAVGQRAEPAVHDVPIERTHALRHFYAGLKKLERGADRKVRVLHYGDSNVAADLWTSVARSALQRRFGDGGPGYVVPGFGSRSDPSLGERKSSGWKARRKGFARDFGPLDGRWGLAGVAAEAGAGGWVQLKMPPMPQGGVLEVHALGQPRGGRLEVRIDGGEPTTIATKTSQHDLIRRRFHLAPGGHTARVRVGGPRPVRLLGVAVELDGPGVVYDVLGINGHRASAILDWDEDLLRAQLEHRRPDLVVLGYGGNEALDPQLDLEIYERKLEQVVGRMQRLVGNADLLLVAPLPMCPARPRVAKVAAVQRRIARRAAIGFWDSSRLSGPDASLCSWRHRRPPLISGDGMHLSKKGYGIVGEQFTEALLRPMAGRLARR